MANPITFIFFVELLNVQGALLVLASCEAGVRLYAFVRLFIRLFVCVFVALWFCVFVHYYASGSSTTPMRTCFPQCGQNTGLACINGTETASVLLSLCG
jgi:hypothetical protein